MWFVERAGDKIGRISLAGAITEYPVPAGLSVMTDLVSGSAITSGSDGALWFVGGAAVIGRVTTHGAFTAIPIPNPSFSTNNNIVGGPDGALWFTGAIAAASRMATTGTLQSVE